MYYDGITRSGIKHKMYSIGVGYIIIPSQVDRDFFIAECFAKETVSMMTEDGAIRHDLKIDKDTIQRIQFPEQGKLGSVIVYVVHFNKNVPIIVGVLNNGNQTQNLHEHEFKIQKTFGNNTVVISGRSDTGEINISSLGGSNGGNLTINLSNNNKDCEFNVNVKGDVNVTADGLTTIDSKGGIKLGHDTYKSMVLGEYLQSWMQDLITQINAITVPTAFGPSGVPINATAISNLVSNLNTNYKNLLSIVSKTE